MGLPIDAAIDAAHSEAERIEANALQVESRIIKAGGIPPRRQYGKPVSTEAIRQNMTLVGLLNKRDPALASYLGIQSGSYAREAAERAERQAAIERIQALTAQTRQQNQAAQLHRERASHAGINPTTGMRLI